MNIYDDIIANFHLKEGDNVWLSSELIKLAVVLKRNNINFDGNELINAFQRIITNSGTLLIPTFNFDFSNKGYYDRNKSNSSVGVLGNIALERNDFIRTKHPLHSFAVWGKHQKELVELKNRHSFGIDSPFAFCVGKHVKQVMLGTDYVRSMTFVHYAEAVCDVPYRFHKEFVGEYIEKDGKRERRTYDYAARYLEIEPTEISNLIGKKLEELGISQKTVWNGVVSYVVELDRSFPIICDDVINNDCKNIYKFNIPREEVFNSNRSR